MSKAAASVVVGQICSACSGVSTSTVTSGCHLWREIFTWWHSCGVRHCSSSTLQTRFSQRKTWSWPWVTWQLRQRLSARSTSVGPGSLCVQSGNPRSMSKSGKLTNLDDICNIVIVSFCRYVISRMQALDYLNLSSCRYLPRGLKKIYRGQEEIQQLQEKLKELVWIITIQL